MFKKILAERATHHNRMLAKCQQILQNPNSTLIQMELAMQQRDEARACLAELIIIENQLSTLEFLSK